MNIPHFNSPEHPRFFDRTLLGLVLFWVFSLSALAQGSTLPSPQSEVVQSESLWRFFENATLQHEVRAQRRALTDQGAVQIGRQSFSVNKDLEQLDVLEAYTLKADGRRIDIQPEHIQVQSGVATGGTGLSWPGVEIRQITYPDVKKGDSVVWRYRKTTHQPALPGWASGTEFAYPWENILKENIRIEAPKAMKLHVFAAHYAMVKTSEGALDIWSAEGNHQAFAMEQNTANSLSWMPRVYMSTLPGQEAWAERFAQRVAAKAVVTPSLQKLADHITENLQSDRDKARAVYDWVRQNLRYVAVYVGTGGFEPNTVGDILRNRYGDCKDHMLLLITLLKATGIEAVPALLNTTPEYALPELPIGLTHTIAYLPSFQQFADPTASTIPFGALPWADSDKPVVVALADGARILRTPAFDAQSNRLLVRSSWTVHRDGQAQAMIEVESTGNAATLLQDQLQQIPVGMGSAAVQRILEGSQLSGKGFITYPAVQRDTQAQSMKLELDDVRLLLADPAAGSLAPHPRLNLPLYILDAMGNYTAEARRNPMTCVPVRLREEFELTLDPAFKVLRAPQNMHAAQEDGIVFNAQYQLDGNRLTGWRELVLDHGRHWCNADQYAQRRETMQRITQHLRAGLLYAQ